MMHAHPAGKMEASADEWVRLAMVSQESEVGGSGVGRR